MDIPVNLAGSLTILLFVGFGIFLYPWLLKRRGGYLAVGALTVMLVVLFYLFDEPAGVETSTSAILAVVWGVLPLAVGLLVRYTQSKGISH
jgi:protein-S-isoprenylcysteine O-methyltransferase Ste14